ncbi:LysR substrate-binding domain-containing protein [Paracoccus sp. MKU1]|uniref:LysR substrate-binding domain-containing protein n=1 Tax=Paracoccus sp. MKU1 TaxID=1745182 RepID=UPI00193CBD77|nr:LysR substrate-binding domain-containing protein [Paracoccus sp. MKU1]
MAELLPLRLADWRAANPCIDLDLKERQSIEIARNVAAGFDDLGILSAAERDRLELHPFAKDRLVVVAAHQDDLARMSGFDPDGTLESVRPPAGHSGLPAGTSTYDKKIYTMD